MKHTFNPRIQSTDKEYFDTTPRCTVCNRYELDHTELATCEGCGAIAACELLNNTLLCALCFDHDSAVPLIEQLIKQFIDNKHSPINTREERITQLANQLGKEIPVDSRAYFVSEVTSIVEIEEQVKNDGITNPQFALAELVESRLRSFRKNLFDLKKIEIELKVNMISDQKYLNQIVPQLRMEEREKFKAYDISYKPNEVIKPIASASKPRTSASERAMESYAKMLGITVEQARLAMASATKAATGLQCTCAATPGLCKIHVG